MYYCCYCGHANKDKGYLESITLPEDERMYHWGEEFHCVHELFYTPSKYTDAIFEID